MKITIITVVYNAEKTIADTIESVLSQEEDVEYIIIDGGSDDGTLKIIERYRRWITKILSEADKGIYDGMNKGLRLASGDIVGFLNADDIYESPYILSKITNVFKNEKIDSSYGDLTYFTENNGDRVIRYWRAGDFNRRCFLWGWMPPHPTFYVRRRIYQRYGLYDLNLGTAADYEIMLRFLVKHKITTVYIPEVLVKMRSGGVSNASLMNRIKANRMDRMGWKINGLKPYPWTIWLKPVRKIGQYLFKKTCH